MLEYDRIVSAVSISYKYQELFFWRTINEQLFIFNINEKLTKFFRRRNFYFYILQVLL